MWAHFVFLDVRLPFLIYFWLDTGTHIRIISSDLLIESYCSDAFSLKICSISFSVVISGFAKFHHSKLKDHFEHRRIWNVLLNFERSSTCEQPYKKKTPNMRSIMQTKPKIMLKLELYDYEFCTVETNGWIWQLISNVSQLFRFGEWFEMLRLKLVSICNW